MDILLINTDQGTHIRPSTVHGMLWLQTHFDDAHWDLLASNRVILPSQDANSLSKDALEAGIKLSCLSSPCIAGKF